MSDTQKYLEGKKHFVSFSFGQTSGYMLHLLREAHAKEWDREWAVIYDNTGKEHDATLDFGHDVETKWGIPIIWLEYCRNNNEHSFRVVDYKTAARRFDKRTPFDEMLEWAGALPNVQGRGCSGQLKVRTTKRFLKAYGLKEWNTYVGIRYDEQHRKFEILSACPKYITPHFPLCDAKTTKEQVNAFWDKQPFKLNIPNYEGNCDLCFLKAKWKRAAIMRDTPEAAQWWIAKQREFEAKGVTGDGARWIAGHDYEALLLESQQPGLFDETEPDIPCSCAVGGYREDSAALTAATATKSP